MALIWSNQNMVIEI